MVLHSPAALVATILWLSCCVGTPPLAEDPPTIEEKIDALLYRLESGAPLQDSYAVELRPITEYPYYGMTTFRGILGPDGSSTGFWLITLDSRQPDSVILDTLIHEWAHALRRHAGSENSLPHDAYWGVAYSEAYQASRDE